MSRPRKGPVLLFIIIAFNLLLLGLHAQSSITNVSCILTGTSIDPGTCILDSFGIAAIALLVSFFILAILYMAGEILNYRALKQFYKNELWEVAKSCIIIIIIFSVLTLSSAIAVSLSGQTPTSSSSGTSLTSNLASLYGTVRTNYLMPQLNASEQVFGELMSLSVGTDLMQGSSIDIWFPLPIPCPACGGIIGSVDFGVDSSLLQSSYITSVYGNPSASLVTASADGVITVLLLMQVQNDLIYAIAALGLGVLIPIGLVLRTVPFMRGVGGTFIALGIGMAIVYPALLIGFNLPVTNYLFSITSANQTQSSCTTLGLICTMLSGPTALVNAVTGYVTGTIPLQFAFGANVNSNSQVSGSGFWTGVFGPFENSLGTSPGGMFPAINFVIDNTLGQFVQFLLFVIDLVMGYAITSGIARLLGGSISLGLGKRFTLA